MNLELDNKVIVVAGGAHGIGASVVMALAGEGAIPFILDSEAPPKELLARTGAPKQLVDLADSAACAAAVERVAARFGRIDGLVNCDRDAAGATVAADPLFASVTRSLTHYLLMTRLCLPHLRRTRGTIVNIANQAVAESEEAGSHVAARAGVLGLTREWAAALAGDAIRVNAVIPARAPAAAPDIRRATPGRRAGSSREIADMAVFLLSPRAGPVTGQCLCVEGSYADPEQAFS